MEKEQRAKIKQEEETCPNTNEEAWSKIKQEVEECPITKQEDGTRPEAILTVTIKEEAGLSVKEEELPMEIGGATARNSPEICPRPICSQDSALKDDRARDELRVVVVDPVGQIQNKAEGLTPSSAGNACSSPASQPQLDMRTGAPSSLGNLMVANNLGSAIAVTNLYLMLYNGAVWPVSVTSGQFPSTAPVTHVAAPPSDSPDATSSPANHQKAQMSFMCMRCGKTFSTKINLFIHEQLHKGERPFGCPMCSRCFASKSSLEGHLHLHTNAKPAVAPVSATPVPDAAPAMQNTKANLAEEIPIEGDDGEFVCVECGKCFYRNSDLLSHQKMHVGKTIVCRLCDKSFPTKLHLINHKSVHTRERPFACSTCGRCFATNLALVGHLQVHDTKKHVSCSQCGRSFTKQEELSQHVEGHHCGICGKTFRAVGARMKHERMHASRRSFPCNECHRSFIRRADLLEHQPTHTEKLNPAEPPPGGLNYPSPSADPGTTTTPDATVTPCNT